MANRLKMAEAYAILALWARGWSFRRIARQLGVHRETVSRYVRAAQAAARPAIPTAGHGGRQSHCEPYRQSIVEALERGLSGRRIFQDLRAEHDFAGGYSSVKRFVRRLRQRTPLPFRRMECAPGEEAQVDFGRGAPIEEPGRKRHRPHLFRIVLSHSRKGYSEVVWRQTTETFIRCLENAFRAFGGVPKTLVIDNLRAAVTKADWYDPDLNPKIEAFARHYGTVILPTKPYTPRHKGKVERGVGYAQDNGLKDRVFTSLGEQNRHLAWWETTIADTRIHGTTRHQVRTRFIEHERPALSPLLPMPFPCFQEATANGLSHAEFLELILQDELTVRQERLIARRMKAAAFRDLKTLDAFDWRFNPSVKKKVIFDLAAGAFIREARDVLMVGPPGVGKSHLCQAIGYEAIKAGFTVLYRSIFDLVRDFLRDEALGGTERILTRYLKPDLLIVDDMGLKQLPKGSGEYLFEIILRRDETRSTMMTSNRPIEEWGKLIGDVPAATAILDRFLHHAEIIAITGKSYRLKDHPRQEQSKHA